MNHIRKLLCLLVAVVMVCSFMTTGALAANGERYQVSSISEHNQAVEAKKQQIEDQYGIYIFYPTYESGGQEVAGIYPETLNTLETALSYVTPSLVLEVSKHYYQRNGKRLRFTYRYADMNVTSVSSGTVDMGGFDPDQSLIELYIPRPGQGAAVTGDIPMTIVHEFGHAVHMMIAESYGYSKMENEWSAYNGGRSYNPRGGDSNPDQNSFISGYGYTDFAEDFAETFAHVYVCNRSGMGFSGRLSANGANTNLGNKVAYLYNLLAAYFPNNTQALANYQKIYSTANAASYNGLTVSGPQLQFMGYAEPRYMPLYHMQNLGIPESRYQWVSAIGAWVAQKDSGGYVLLFPDANWAETTVNIFAAA